MLKRVITICIIVCLLAPLVALGDGRTYIYDPWGEAVPSQDPYIVENIYDGIRIGVGSFNAPSDLYVDAQNIIYILDAGNNRIVILDEGFNLIKTIERFISVDGKEETLKDATGIFVDEKQQIYIADKGNQRVLVVNYNGEVIRTVTKPDSILIDESMAFEPRKVLVDKSGVLYVISEKLTQGAYMIGPNNEFLGFYGRNKVRLTAERIAQLFWRRIATEKQRARMENFIPIEFYSFDIDERGFIYTVNAYSDDKKNDEMIRKLNPMGNNILPNGGQLYGDQPDFTGLKPTDPLPSNVAYKTSYVDVTVDQDGFIYALDGTNCRIFQYDQEGRQVFIFGARGNQVGTFKNPVAIENIKGKIIVLDATKNNITVFKPSYFGEQVRKAIILYNEGRFSEAVKPWQEVLRMNSNYHLAYVGIGKAYYEEGKFKEAMKYFLLGVDEENYSKAKREYRNEQMKRFFPFIFCGVIVILIVILVAERWIKLKMEALRQHVIGGEI